MKKKLFLNRETVRKLSTADLHEVAGGAKSKHCDSAECSITPALPIIPDQPVLPVHP